MSRRGASGRSIARVAGSSIHQRRPTKRVRQGARRAGTSTSSTPPASRSSADRPAGLRPSRVLIGSASPPGSLRETAAPKPSPSASKYREARRRADRPGPDGRGTSPRKAPAPTLAGIRQVIARIPRGRVATYGQVAEAMGLYRSARLTAWALQVSEGLPWHRVVGAEGRIALDGEAGREQRFRLRREGVRFRRDRVRMDLHQWSPPRARPADRLVRS